MNVRCRGGADRHPARVMTTSRRRFLPRLAAVSFLALAVAPFSFGIGAAIAQVPPPVPALPDTERRTSYTISSTTCACAVNFAIFASGTDVDEWIEVWIAGTRYLSTDPTFGWSLSSVTGALATIPRPITNAVLTFNSAQTGTVQIVGAERPRRTVQFTENRGVAARDLNQALTELTAENRETWDKTNDLAGRTVQAPPGETLSVLSPAATRASQFFIFDANGNPSLASPGLGLGNVVGPISAVNNHVAVFSGTTGKVIADGGTIGSTTLTGDVTGSGTVTFATTLATVNSNVGTFGSATQCLTVTVNGKGLITAASVNTCTPAFSSLTGQATLAQLPSIANNTILANISGSSAVPAADGLSAIIDSAIASTQGDILYRNASSWVALAPGSSGQLLQSGGAAANPSWVTATGTGTVTSAAIAAGTGISVSGTCTITTSGTCTVTNAAVLHYQAATFTTDANSTTSTVYHYSCDGGGGGGGGSNGTAAGGGGGAGAHIEGTFNGVAGGVVVTITKGAGGTAGANTGGNGGNGGATSIAATGLTTLSAGGGTGGTGVTSGGGTGGAGGVPGGGATASNTGATGGTGTSIPGSFLWGGQGGGSRFGSGAIPLATTGSTIGINAVVPASGGSGGAGTGEGGGTGAAGFCEVDYVL